MSARKPTKKLPKTVSAPGGAVTVEVKKSGQVRSGSTEAWGTWEAHTRRIEIDGSSSLLHQWRTLFHELTHVALDDSGLSNGMPDELVEAVCDAVATQRVRETFG